MKVNTHNISFSQGNEKLEKLKKVCDEFESEILNFYLKEAMSSNESLFPKSPGEKIYRSMYEETLSQHISGNFGYSELLFNYLKDRVK